MPRPRQITPAILAPIIRARGPVSATDLASLLGVNRTTIARALPDFGDELVTLGATRSTRYLLRRSIRNIGDRWPIYRIDERGRATEWAGLQALHENSWLIRWTASIPEWGHHFTDKHGLCSGFPFFLGDVRPQGFLGRLIAGRLSRTLQVPEDARRWADEDTLVYLASEGEDLPGNLVVGDDCLRGALTHSPFLSAEVAIDDTGRAEAYPAEAMGIANRLPGSSAGGEQPKFLTTLRTGSGGFQSVLVKFSPPIGQETGRRWADLLVCEFHAHEILAEAGLANPGTRILDAGGRRFLEIPRFDRSESGGRLGVVTLEALTTAATGTLPRSWTAAAAELQQLGLINDDTRSTIAGLQSFGELIGNSDMHAGNLAFFLGDSLPLPLTPAYDMLPMLWAPGRQGEIVERHFAPAPPVPAIEPAWRVAAPMAESFWHRSSTDPRLSAAFASFCAQAAETVHRLRRHVG
jgi:hypothetical protein